MAQGKQPLEGGVKAVNGIGADSDSKRVEGVFSVYGLAREHLGVARRDARPVRRLPGVEPYDDFRPSRWCHGGILQSSGRSEALPATPTLPGRGARARQFPISRPGRRAPPVATPPRALFGAGADGHPEAPDRRPLGACPYRRQCAECSPLKFIGSLSRTVMGAPKRAAAPTLEAVV